MQFFVLGNIQQHFECLFLLIHQFHAISNYRSTSTIVYACVHCVLKEAKRGKQP